MRVAKRPPAAIQAVDEALDGPADEAVDEAIDEYGIELVRRAAAGDQDAFRTLFERHHARVYRYALLRVGDAEAAWDLTQDIFLAVWSGLPAFVPQHSGSFPAWVFRISRNVVASYHRTAHRTVAVPDELLPDEGFEFEGMVVTQQLLENSLAVLSEDQREVLILRFLVGLPTGEVAEAMGRSEGAVTALQMRALAKLRSHLEEES